MMGLIFVNSLWLATGLLPELARRLAAIDAGAVERLERFYDKELESFAVEPGVAKFSVTSTCCAVDALGPRLASPVALMRSEWREKDLFQLPLIVHALSRLGEEDGPRVESAVETLIKSRARLQDTWKQTLSCYLQYWLAAALLEYGKEKEGMGLALSRAYEVARSETCRQLAFHASGDRSNFDVTRLAYSLLAYAGVGGRREFLKELSAPDAEDVDVNPKLCASALDAIFSEQRSDGLWPAGQAIYAKSRRGFDVGNAYVFAPDMVASLLETLPPECFEKYLPNLSKLVSWIEEHDVEGGWRSNHLVPGGPPMAWSTAQTLKCCARMLETTQHLLNLEILREFGGEVVPRSQDLFANLLDSDVVGTTTLKDVVRSRFLEEDAAVPKAWSAVLFGPPGTAKTTIAEAVARFLGAGFVVIDTGTFLSDGLGKVASRIAYVFSRLRMLRGCVVLFDEIEEFCLERSEPAAMESRMLTTAMLTQLNDLRRAQKSIFFIATNKVSKLDTAVTRPGRMDLLLFVGTPNRAARVQRFAKKCQDFVEVFDEFLETTWDEESQFLNYLESERFASLAAAHAAKTGTLTPPILANLLKTQTSVMVLRDAASRKEVLDSQAFARI